MKKKLFIVLLCVLSLFMLLSCAKKAEPVATAKESENSIINVKMAGMRQDNHTPFANSPYFKDMEDKTKVHIDWIDWPQSQLKEKRNLAFASGTLPDAFYGSFILDGPDVVKYGNEGFFADLTPYLNDTYMPNFMAACKDRPDILPAITAPDGKVYALPSILETPFDDTNDTLVINTEWLKKVGKEMPTTTDELFDVLMAFKQAGDLNGNGRNDEIPLTFVFNQGNMGLFSFMGYTGLCYNNQHARMARKNGEVVFVPGTEEFKEWVTFMHKLYKNGLVDPEAFTMKNAAFNAKTQTNEPTCGVISAWSAEKINAPIKGNDPYKDGVYQYISPLNGPNGVTPKWCLRTTPANRQFAFAINADSKYIEQLVRWADTQYDPKTSFAAKYGKEGKHYEFVNDNGDYKPLLKEDGKSYTEQEIAEYSPSKDALFIVLAKNFRSIKPQNVQGKAKAHEVYEAYLDHDFVRAYPLQTPEEVEQISIIMPDMKTYVDNQTAKFITEGGIEEGWDAYIKGLKNIKIDEYVRLYTQIDNRAK